MVDINLFLVLYDEIQIFSWIKVSIDFQMLSLETGNQRRKMVM